MSWLKFSKKDLVKFEYKLNVKYSQIKQAFESGSPKIDESYILINGDTCTSCNCKFKKNHHKEIVGVNGISIFIPKVNLVGLVIPYLLCNKCAKNHQFNKTMATTIEENIFSFYDRIKDFSTNRSNDTYGDE